MLNISKHYLARNDDHLPNVCMALLKLHSTLHEVAWQLNNLAYSSGLMFVWLGHF